MSQPEDLAESTLKDRGARGEGGSTARRVAINTVSNWVAMGAQVFALMFLLSYVYKKFEVRYGVDEVRDLWGVYRLSTYFTMAVTFLSFGLAGSVIRLASESVATRDKVRLSQISSVSRTVLLLSAAVGLGAMVLVSVLLLDVLNVPEAYRSSATTLFQLTALSGAFQMLYILYRGLLQAKQRYDLANAALIAEVLIRVALVVVCFELGWQRLEILGYAVAIASLVGLVMLVIMVRCVLPELRMSFLNLNRSVAKEVLSFGAWVTVSQASRQVMETGGPFIVSATLGTGAAGVYGIPQLFTDFLLRVVTGVTQTLRPVASEYAILGRRDELARLYRVSTRLSMVLVALPTAVLVTHGQPFIIYWTGPQMADAYYVMLVCIGLSFVRLIGVPAEHVILSTGHIGGLVLSGMVASVMGLGLALGVASWTDWGIYGLVVALFLPMAIRSLVYLPHRMRIEAPVTWGTTIFGCVIPPMLAAVVPAGAGVFLRWIWPPGSLWAVLVQMALMSIPYAPVVWFAVLNADERGIIRRALLPARLMERLAKGRR